LRSPLHIKCLYKCLLKAWITLLLTPALQPDLPIRWRQDIPASKGDRQTYYGYESPSGYIDYPFADGSVEPPQYKPKPQSAL
jgi:hypothetical protein